jgi:hypothetical protein
MAVEEQTLSRRGMRRGEEFTLSFRGPADRLSYLEPFVSAHAFDPGSTSFEPSRPPDLSYEIVFGGRPRAVPDHASFALPLRIHMVVDLLSTDPEDRPSRRQTRQQRKRVLRYGYGYRFSHSAADFDHFYTRMHVATMRRRHGANARSMSREQAFDTIFMNGALLFVTRDGVDVAAVLCHFRDEVCDARLVGWLDGDDSLLEQEALKTGNHFLLEWTRLHGFESLDFQGCEPFIHKGTFQSKRHLGASVIIPDNDLGRSHIRMTVDRDTRAVRNLLAELPWLGWDAAGQLRPILCHDSANSPSDAEHAYARSPRPLLVDLDEVLA